MRHFVVSEAGKVEVFSSNTHEDVGSDESNSQASHAVGDGSVGGSLWSTGAGSSSGWWLGAGTWLDGAADNWGGAIIEG